MNSILKHEFKNFSQSSRSLMIDFVNSKLHTQTKFVNTSSCQLAPKFKRHYSEVPPPNADLKQQTRRKGLMLLTYISGAIGAVLLTAVGAREYQRLKFRARGIEPVKNRLWGRKPYAYIYRGFLLPKYAVDNIDKIHTFEIREDDVFVASFPKSGTTWAQEIVYLIVNNLDFDKAKSQNIDDRFPFFEFLYPGISTIAKASSPRCIKTHLPLSLLPNDVREKKPKIIYVTRNPKDSVVSFYHFVTKFLSSDPDESTAFRGTLEDFCELFVKGEGFYGPWWKHTKEAWDRRDEDNILFLTYEEMKADLPEAIRKVAAFLGKSLSSQEVEMLAAHCSFDSMRNNNSVNYSWFKTMSIANKNQEFLRKGEVGDWKNHISSEMAAKFDEMMASKLPADLVFENSNANRIEK